MLEETHQPLRGIHARDRTLNAGASNFMAKSVAALPVTP